MNTRELYGRVARQLETHLPPGIPPEYLRDFLRRHEAGFIDALSRRLVALCGPDKLVEGYERLLGINTEPGKNGHLHKYLLGLKARCHPGNPAIRQYTVHWRYDGALKKQKDRWVRVVAKASYDDQPWKLMPDTSWIDAAWNEEEAIRRFIEDYFPNGVLWWLEEKRVVGPGADVDPLEDERTQLTDTDAIRYAREWRDTAPQLEFDPEGIDHLRDQRQREATAAWWRSRALLDPEPTPYLEPTQQMLHLGGSSRGQASIERLPSTSESTDACPDCNDRGWYHAAEGQLERCTYCGRFDSDEAMAEAHFELGCDECGWPAGGVEDRSGSMSAGAVRHPAIGSHARLREDWYDDLTWKHTFRRGLSGTIVDIDAHGIAELNFDQPLPMSWRMQDDDPGALEGIYLPLERLEVEGGAP